MCRWPSILLIGCLQSCALTSAVDTTNKESPSPELGRPDWVTYPARTGSWFGGVGGLVVSLGTLPLTYPISVLADEPLGSSKQEFLYLPTAVGASLGHVAFGMPLDFFDWMFRRAWVATPLPVDYELILLPPPAPLVVPEAVPAAEKEQIEAGKSGD